MRRRNVAWPGWTSYARAFWGPCRPTPWQCWVAAGWFWSLAAITSSALPAPGPGLQHVQAAACLAAACPGYSMSGPSMLIYHMAFIEIQVSTEYKLSKLRNLTCCREEFSSITLQQPACREAGSHRSVFLTSFSTAAKHNCHVSIVLP